MQKQKLIRGNRSPFINKDVSKAMVKQTEVFSKNLRLHTNTTRPTSTRQRNYYSSLTRKQEKQFYRNLDIKDATDKKTFWKTIKPLFPDKTKSSNTLTLLEKRQSSN